jgi:hypothetical protein
MSCRDLAGLLAGMPLKRFPWQAVQRNHASRIIHGKKEELTVEELWAAELNYPRRIDWPQHKVGQLTEGPEVLFWRT